ncbi:MAG: 3-dehydroquinate synthase [Flavobacteriaceae bacterium]|nr:3-dehydroquinate synthase [Flavobacteriaceae bacterium]
MQSIKSGSSTVYFNTECYSALNQQIATNNYSNIFILVDSNTHEFCIPYFMGTLETDLQTEIIEIQAGEIHKTIETCSGVWNVMSELNGDRKSILINLGGGVITDLGGFVASCFKRGIDFVNIPTTLLAMVDASVGGKNGVDLGSLKNQIGVINLPELVLIDTTYLDTLPAEQMRSGLAEMLKHGLIQDKAYWDKMKDLSSLTLEDLDQLIYESVLIKNKVVLEDPTEKGMRKTLNFGHTLGHAIESYFLENTEKQDLLHGEAVAIGMILACYISNNLTDFPSEALQEVSEVIIKNFNKKNILDTDYSHIIELMKYDKKNTHGKINFVLLSKIGSTVIDQSVPNELIIKAFDYYNSL